MSKYKLEVGDNATVFFTQDNYFDGVIRYIPQATGDAWVFTDKNENLVYVQTYECIVAAVEEDES